MTPVKRIHEQVREKYMDIGTEVPYVFKQVCCQICFIKKKAGAGIQWGVVIAFLGAMFLENE